MGGRGREGEPVEWTGQVCCLKLAIEANPDCLRVTAAPSGSNPAEVIAPHAAKKSLSPEIDPPVPQTDTGRQGELPQGDRATLRQGTRQIDPVPSEEGVP